MVRLDKRLLNKIHSETGKPVKYVRELISKRASRLGISSEAFQVLWAKKLGIGTAHFQRTLSSTSQQEIRDSLLGNFAKESLKLKPRTSGSKSGKTRRAAPLRAAIQYLLMDDELRNRCTDLLLAKGNYDRVFREATTVLEHRLRKLALVTDKKIKACDLAAKVLHPNNAILRVSEEDGEQEGFYQICRGLFQTFRNPTHHQLSEKFRRENTLQFCGFVDSLLATLEQAQIRT